MTEAQTIDAGTVTKRSRGSSFIAKCTAPFVAKQRSQVEQEIRLDEPFRQYAPGDSVKGVIRAKFGKPMRLTHLVIRLHGFVKVFSRAQLPGEVTPYDDRLMTSGNGGGRLGSEYFRKGYARLFEDEAVLCGEGRVHGEYEFRFEMVLPSKHVPSSIDFEQGTISYFITSTVTRPTAIAPTTTQHFKLHVQEVIDIASIPKPKAVALSMETLHKKRKTKIGGKSKDVPSGSERASKSSSRDSTNDMLTVRRLASQNFDEPPSPVPSEPSSATAATSSTSSDVTYSGEPPLCTINNATEDLMTISNPNTVFVKTEISKGGCLAGDHLDVRVSIKHNKSVKNMQGIIVTLYRQGRIDTRPVTPPAPSRKGEKRHREDYYPKSRTGLGGLSLSSTGSSRRFRQDLAQIVLPMIIDPKSLTAVINGSIAAPPHLFPSIRDVPGALVSFRYFLEIVIDLRGKASGQDRIQQHLSMTSTPQHGYGDPKVSGWEGPEGVNYHSAPAFNYLITDQLRRARGTISTRTEVVVGTRDSARRRGKQAEDPPKDHSVRLGREEDPEGLDIGNDDRSSVPGFHAEYELVNGNGNGIHSVNIIPLPEPDEEDLDEKARLKRAEQRLLPSEAPRDDTGPSSSTILTPSAPPALDEEDFHRRYGFGAPAPAPAYDGPPPRFTEDENSQDRHAMRTPPVRQNTPNTQDDKQELERQRLLAMASSPDIDTDDAGPAGSTPRALVPSAPVLYEDDVFSVNDPRIPGSSSPNLAAPEDLINEPQLSAVLVRETVSDDLDRTQEHYPSRDRGTHDGRGSRGSDSTTDRDMHAENLPTYIR